ncbi:MAG: ATP-binding protein [Emcibacteraceae bacterium]
MTRHRLTANIDQASENLEELTRIRKQAARLEAIVHSQPDCVKIVSSDYKLIDMNEAGLEMVDAGSLEDVKGACLLDLVDPEFHELFKESVDLAYRGKPSEIEFNITGLNGSKRRMSQRAAPIFDRDNPDHVIEMVAVTRDISDKHATLASLEDAKIMAEEASKLKSNFLATMSHEFRTPLNAILGFSEIIKSKSLGEIGIPKYEEYIEDIYNSGRHLLDIINDVLDISEIEAKKRIFLKEEIDLEDVALECLSTVNILAQEKQIIMSANIGANLPRIYADKRSIKQILINLLSNAVKFSHDGSVVILSIYDNGKFLKINIKDTGIGISKEFMKDIAKPFFRGQAEADITAPGTGLGLSIVKSLISEHDAQMEIESEEHVGTTVKLSFPINS